MALSHFSSDLLPRSAPTHRLFHSHLPTSDPPSCSTPSSKATHPRHHVSFSPEVEKLLGEWECSFKFATVAKLGELKIVIGVSHGNVTVLTHQSTSEFRVHHRLQDSHSSWVNDIDVHGDLFVTCSNDGTAKVWDTNSLTVQAILSRDNSVVSTAVSDRNIAASCYGPKIRVFRNWDDHNLLFVLPLSALEFQIGQVAFLNYDVVAVSCGLSLYFISLPTKSVLSCVRTEEPVNSFTVLGDGRIAIGGGVLEKRGYCASFAPPKSAQGAVDD